VGKIVQESGVMIRHTIVDIVACVAKTIQTATSELHASRTLESMALRSNTVCFEKGRGMLLLKTNQVTSSLFLVPVTKDILD
jgi:hypothetical protein